MSTESPTPSVSPLTLRSPNVKDPTTSVSAEGHRLYAYLQDWYTKELSVTADDPFMLASAFGFDDLPLFLIGKAIAATSVEDVIGIYKDSRSE